MIRTFVQRGALLFAAVIGLIGTAPRSASAQKALVYCPVDVDATGCTTIVNALTGPMFPLGVDKGYDGTNGTVDLKTVDLFSYSVFVVPSLADGSSSQPYATLRDPEVQEHLKAALIGRIAMWSGTPDQGATNRGMKDALIQNLTGWAAGAYATAKGPGLVSLLDASASVVTRYDWVRAIAPLPVTSDANLLIYNGVRSLNQRATSILTSGAGPIVYDNMATFGFQVPNGAAGVSLDAVGQTGTSQGGQVVLLTMEAGNASGATVKTDKDDYAPGQTVTITGSGWQAGETIKLTLHMDPLRDNDTELAATADENGKFANAEFAPGDYDVGVRFVLTAVGQSSGRRAQATFTDGNVSGATIVLHSPTCVRALGTVNVGTPVCATGTISVSGAGTGDYRIQWVSPTSVLARDIGGTANNGDSYSDTFSPTAAGTWTFLICKTGNGGSCSSGQIVQSATFTVVGTLTTTAALTSSLNASTYGESVTFTATVTASTNPTCGSIAFKDGATILTTATLSGTNSATYATSALTAGSHSLSAVYTPAASGCSFTTSTGLLTQSVNKATLTLTAEDKTRGYGDANPPFTATYDGFVNSENLGTSGVTGTPSLTTTAVANTPIGSATITAAVGTLTATNYQFAFVNGTLTISTRAITVTADPKTKTYGDADPPLTYQITAGSLLGGDAISGALTRAAGESVVGGPYAIQQGTLTAGTNYTLSYVGASLTISTRAASVTPNVASKTYGDPDPAFSGTVTGFVSTDNVTATYSRTAGETVLGGPYTISATLAPAGVLANYDITYNTAAFTISARTASVTPNAASKEYGAADPLLTGTLAGFVGTDNVTASYTRTAGETVLGSPYTISGTLAPAGVLSNYNITYNTATFSITPKAASVTPNAAGKTYGDADPALTGALSGFLSGDNVTATYTRTAGETVASSPYTISATLAPVGVLSNYTITYNTAAFTIGAKNASVTPSPASKPYGDADPALTGTLSGFVPADGVTATYARTAGETVGGSPYTITATLAPAGVLGNYNITYNTANFTINPKTASITPNAASKEYGTADPVLSGTLSGFLPADGVTATYSRATGETVLGGPYTISATLSPTAVLSNYTITYNTADFTITPKAASVSPNPASKVYGDSDPVLSGSLAGFLSTDGVTATYSRIAGETVAASPYTISATLSPAGVLSNYAITYNTASFTISPRPASVTPNSASKEYGAMDPAFAGTLSGFLPADGVTATYSRNAGETVLGGLYAISGTLSPAGVLGNYDITYNTASFTITAKPASVTPNVAGKVYGDADPALTGTLSGFLAADNVTAAYSRVAGETVAGGPYTISATLSPPGVLSNYNITYNTAAFTITTKAASVTPNPKSKVYGMADPVLDGTLSGFLSADGVTATYSRTAGEDVATSPYTISATLSPAAVLTNYNITYNTANLTITPKPLTITADNKTVLYGTAPVFSVMYGPFAFADGASALSGSLMFGGSAVGATNVGTYTIVPSGLTSTNYAITFVNGTLEIDPKPLTVSVVSVTRDFGNVTPLSFSVTYSPFAYSETSSVLSGALVFTPAASTFNNTTPAGVTTINASGLTATNYSISFVSGTMTILDKTAPVVSMTAISPNPVPLNTPITLTAKITDAVTGGSNIVSACYKVDGGTCIPMTGPFGSQTVNVTGTIPGMSTADVVEVCVYGKDSATNVNAKMDCVLVAIYDPNAGFVTGGGWIDSPPNAYVTNPGLTGKANFGFVSKYKKGANVPDGNTEFQFHAGNLNFKSSVYEWLVVAGARAQFKGTGTINGSGNYGFLLTAIDGQINGGGGSDKFRIKIWDKNNGDAVVYDNQIGNLDTADPTTLLGGGSINIQAK